MEFTTKGFAEMTTEDMTNTDGGCCLTGLLSALLKCFKPVIVCKPKPIICPPKPIICYPKPGCKPNPGPNG